ncbi:type II secretion system protein [Priestia koreensis]|uniref:type II secretion system protein n=1 Tax=Priestia koreensis TaxID=284581 RepID=UPI001F55B63F|nr:type II secretion system protein [Priestia koreensis]UNL84365.1 type II secretion system protein [Priestia koreensis]
MKRYKKLQNQQGMTIIELLVSLVILTLLFTGAMQFFPQSFSYTRDNQSKTIGINVARNTLHYMQGQSFLKIKKEIKDSKKVLSLYICERKENNEAVKFYSYQDNNLPIPTDCKNIEVNSLSYKVTMEENNDKGTDTYKSSIIPITITVKWKGKNADLSTSVKGDIVSEDLRETN